jgi:coenzyme F420 hydrogenase subunit beta
MEEMVFGRRRDLENQTEYFLGIVNQSYAAHAIEDRVRNGGASGGTATALMGYMLDKGIADALLIAGFKQDRPWVTEPKVITDKKELLNWQGSVYNRVPMGNALNSLMKSDFQRIAIIGVPCFIHALRKMQLHRFPANIGKRITFMLGLICGTCFSVEGVFHIFKEKMGIGVEEIEKLNFRGGEWPGSLVVRTKDGRELAIPQSEYKHRFLVPLFRVDRCIKCWDFAADLADLSLGDLWSAPWPMVKGGAGWNSAIVKTPLGKSLFEAAARENYIKVEPIPIKHIFDLPGCELKKHSNSYFMAIKRKHGEPVPEYGYETDSYLKPHLSREQVYSP